MSNGSVGWRRIASRAELSTTEFVYQLKVTLRDTKPPIWRRIQVRSDVTLGKLHDILQVIMGWEDDHLHQFMIDDVYYSRIYPDLDFGRKVEDESKVKLDQVIPAENIRFGYEYDFGDNWYHQIPVEKILSSEERKYYPVCIKGERACPPEDVGSVWSYDSFLSILSDPDNPERVDLLEWVGGDFDPEQFDLEAVNKKLRRIS